MLEKSQILLSRNHYIDQQDLLGFKVWAGACGRRLSVDGLPARHYSFLKHSRYLAELISTLKHKGDLGRLEQNRDIFPIFSWPSRGLRLGALKKENF